MSNRLDGKYQTDNYQELISEITIEIFDSRCLDNPYVVDDEGNETLREDKQEEFISIHTWVENKFEAYARKELSNE
jgi:hypothetical protein